MAEIPSGGEGAQLTEDMRGGAQANHGEGGIPHRNTDHLGGGVEPTTDPDHTEPSHLGGGAEPLGTLTTTTNSALGWGDSDASPRTAGSAKGLPLATGGEVSSSSSTQQTTQRGEHHKQDADISDLEGASPITDKGDGRQEGSSAGTSSQTSQSKRAHSKQHKGRGNKQPPKQSRKSRTHVGERRPEKDASSTTSSTEGEARINKEAIAKPKTRTRESQESWANLTEQEVTQREEALGDSPQWRTPENLD